MNQRLSRNSKKNNNMDFVSLNAGGHVTRHIPNEDPQVQVPQKTTGDIKPESRPGTAKASPNFKPIAKTTPPPSKEDEKKVIASNTVETEETKDQ